MRILAPVSPATMSWIKTARPSRGDFSVYQHDMMRKVGAPPIAVWTVPGAAS